MYMSPPLNFKSQLDKQTFWSKTNKGFENKPLIFLKNLKSLDLVEIQAIGRMKCVDFKNISQLTVYLIVFSDFDIFQTYKFTYHYIKRQNRTC